MHKRQATDTHTQTHRQLFANARLLHVKMGGAAVQLFGMSRCLPDVADVLKDTHKNRTNAPDAFSRIRTHSQTDVTQMKRKIACI